MRTKFSDVIKELQIYSTFLLVFASLKKADNPLATGVILHFVLCSKMMLVCLQVINKNI